MKTLTTIKSKASKKAAAQLGEFSTAREAAQAKSADLMKSLSKADLSFLKKN